MKKYIFLLSIIVLTFISHWIYTNLDKPIVIENYKKGNLEVRITKKEELDSDRYHVTIMANAVTGNGGINTIKVMPTRRTKQPTVEVISMQQGTDAVAIKSPFFIQRVVIPGKVIGSNATYQVSEQVLEWKYARALPKKNLQMYVDYEVPQKARMFLLMVIMIGLGIGLVWMGYFWIKKAFE